MNKIIVKVLIIVALVLGLANYLSYVKTGKGLIDVNDISAVNISFDISRLKGLLPSDGDTKTSKGVLYKWVDADGLTQYTQELPPKNTVAEKILLDDRPRR